MANLYWTFNTTVDPHQLSVKILYEHQYETEFAALTGEHYFKYWGKTVESASDSDNPARPGSMIMEHMDLKSGGSTIDIPVIIPDNSAMVVGDQDMKTRGVRNRIAFIPVGVNRYQKAYDVIVKGTLQSQILGQNLTNAINQGAQQLKWDLTRTVDKDLYHTVFTGTSMHMSNLSGVTGVRNFRTPHSHPNFWTEKGGMVPKIAGALPGSAGYETAVVGALNGVDTTHKMTAAVIKKLEYHADRLQIPYFETKLGKRRILIISEEQRQQLEDDEVYQKAKIEAFSGTGWEADAFNNFRAQYSKTLIFSTMTIPGVRVMNDTPATVQLNASFNNMPYYTPEGWYNDLSMIDSTPLRVGILCGPDMLHKAYGSEAVSFRSYTDTSAETEQLIISATMAYVLADIQDDSAGLITGTASEFYKNQTSLVFATWSPTL